MGERRHHAGHSSKESQERWLKRRSRGDGQPSPRVLSDVSNLFAPPPGRGGPQWVPRPPEAKLGPDAPWSNFGPKRSLTKSQILSAISTSAPSSPDAVAVDGRQPSAVLVLVIGAETKPELVFTRRAWHLRSHTGEISFPGGRFEQGDVDLTATALRESHEEIGLDPGEVEVIGELDRLTTVSSPALIVPYVGTVNGEPTMVGSPDEVDAIIRVPVAELLQPDIYRCEIWPWPGGGEIEITFFELVGDTLWGATARMVRNFLETVLPYASADD